MGHLLGIGYLDVGRLDNCNLVGSMCIIIVMMSSVIWQSYIIGTGIDEFEASCIRACLQGVSQCMATLL